MLRALLFDVDGTLAETEEGHREAWNAAFAAHGLGWSWDRDLYRQLLQIAGGRERLAHYANGRLGTADLVRIHADKDRRYRDAAASGRIALRPGVAALIAEARKREIRLGIATTTSRSNVEALVKGTLGEEAIAWFAVWACAEDAAAKKPDPAVYHVAIERLGLAPEEVVAIEDSRNGLLAADRAGIRVVFSPSLYMSGDDASEAMLVLPDLASLAAGDLLGRLA